MTGPSEVAESDSRRRRASVRVRAWWLSPRVRLVAPFVVASLVGAVLLSLPFASVRGGLAFVDALFMSTSAVCVTGLITVDTGSELTRGGQVVILLLIQVGGLGVMTSAAVIFRLLGRRMSVRSREIIEDALFQRDAAGEFRRLFLPILAIVLVAEAIGTAVLYARLPDAAVGDSRLFTAVFHAVSAFCNAGFSLWSDSLEQLAALPEVMVTVAVLIVIGGLGHTVLVETGLRIFRRLRRLVRGANGPMTRMSLHSRVVWWVSLVLTVGGALLIWLVEPAAGDTHAASAGHALFQSITARTAGFNSVTIGELASPALLLLVALMFIGGSPGSCAGGIKTTTFAMWLAWIRARILRRPAVTLLDRQLPGELVRRALLVLSLAVLWNAFGLFLLAITEGPAAAWRDLLFEQVSAFCTVGLSTGITPTLSPAGKLWIVLTMLVGRLGPLAIVLARHDAPPGAVRYPDGRVMIG